MLRFLTAVQLLPALEGGEETLVGGQAVLEGVMMRSPHAWAIAVRRPSGEIVDHCEPLERPSEKHKWMGWPIVRGVVTLGQAMMLGFRALRFSANVALDDLPRREDQKKLEISGWLAAVNIAISLGFFILVYKFVPLVAATELKRLAPAFSNHIVFNLMDGAVRIGLFLLFISGLSLWADVHRVFEYHGAEHKTVFAFLMTLMLISILVYTLVPATTFWGRFGARLALLPLIVGLSYEIIRFAARRRGTLFGLMTRPGLWLQRITTQPPQDGQVECAIVALNDAMALERQRGGELVIG